MSKDLEKEHLYESVKTLVETENNLKRQLGQHKLYSLCSVGLQYLLFKSMKVPGHYLIRLQSAQLTQKLSSRAKDPRSRQFFRKIAGLRKIKYGQSTFILDYFAPNTWNLLSNVPNQRLKGVLVVKPEAVSENQSFIEEIEDGDKIPEVVNDEKLFLHPLYELDAPILYISHSEIAEDFKSIEFPWITDKKPKLTRGVKIAAGITLDEEEDDS